MNTLDLRVDPARPPAELLAQAAALVKRGGIVAFPTETVYGIGCLPEFAGSVERIYALKGRGFNKPLAVYLAEPAAIAAHTANVPEAARRLIDRYLPGPITMILNGPSGDRIGFRVSPDPTLSGLLRALGDPLVATSGLIVGTSANLSGRPSPRDASEVLEAFNGRIEVVLDAGRTPLGTDSTVLDCTTSPPTLLREGAIPASEIAALLGTPLRFA
ncbi:MAG: threonylcarbamoyl-AMP synthase [Verrucomicrobia bacterium]|nr:threonylcarbamoyl-AMP synthase [Verrucomicrobiota bacterium]